MPGQFHQHRLNAFAGVSKLIRLHDLSESPTIWPVTFLPILGSALVEPGIEALFDPVVEQPIGLALVVMMASARPAIKR